MAEINDNMRILHGEVRYLESGEYPTVDLSTKIKPQFDLKPRARRLTEQNSIGQKYVYILYMIFALFTFYKIAFLEHLIQVAKQYWSLTVYKLKNNKNWK